MTFPYPDTLSPSEVKQMNATSWIGLALWCAGHAFQGTWQAEKDVAPATPADRAKAADLIERSLEALRAESLDEIRANVPSREGKRIASRGMASPLEEWIEAMRNIAGNPAAAVDALREKMAEVPQDHPQRAAAEEILKAAGTPRDGVSQILTTLVLSWDVLKAYRANPDVVLSWDELHAMRGALIAGADLEPGVPVEQWRADSLAGKRCALAGCEGEPVVRCPRCGIHYCEADRKHYEQVHARFCSA